MRTEHLGKGVEHSDYIELEVRSPKDSPSVSSLGYPETGKPRQTNS